MKEEARRLLEKAERSLKAAETLIKAGDAEFAAGRAYSQSEKSKTVLRIYDREEVDSTSNIRT